MPAGAADTVRTAAPPAASTCARVRHALEETIEYWQIRRAVKEELIKPGQRADTEPLEAAIPRILEDGGHATRLRNSAFAWHEREALAAAKGGLVPAASLTSPSPSAAAAAAFLLSHESATAAATAAAAARSPSHGASPGHAAAASAASASASAAADAVAQRVALLRRLWQDRAVERLTALCVESGVPWVQPDPLSAQIAAIAAAAGLDASTLATLSAPPAPTVAAPTAAARIGAPAADRRAMSSSTYTPADLFDFAARTGAGLCPPGATTLPAWSLLPPAMPAPALAALRALLPELAPAHRHVGCDDALHPWYAAERCARAERMAAGNSIPVCRQFLRSGCPSGARPRLWAAALGVEVGQRETAHFERLCGEVERREMLVDALTRAEARALSDTDDWFLFDELIKCVLLAFSRDAAVAALCAVPPHPVVPASASAPLAAAAARTGTPALYPPSGVLPFAGLARYAAPLAYLHAAPAPLYFLFRALYCRHLCGLHTLAVGTPTQPALLLLAKTTEDLVQETEPEVCFHLLDHGCAPLRLVWPWLVSGFSGVLPVEQLLLLWDRVIGFESLQPLAVLAAALLRFRRAALLAGSKEADFRLAVSDMSQLLVVPLMQDLLRA